jgi:tetratricopeptide (TPR) repeat protein
MSFDRTRSIALACLCALAMAVGAPAASASDNPDLDKAIYDLSIKWETAKFDVPPGDEQTKQMDALGEEADALLEKYPDRVEAMIWDGILTSERASLTSAFAALRLAKRARGTLEKAYELDPAALDAGAPTSLGVLYYRVPGWPIGFGDTDKARQLLEQATKLAPEGLDAWYFYGDFLYNESEYPEATAAFQHALAIPVHPDRPLWDKSRRLVIQEVLTKIQQKS